MFLERLRFWATIAKKSKLCWSWNAAHRPHFDSFACVAACGGPIEVKTTRRFEARIIFHIIGSLSHQYLIQSKSKPKLIISTFEVMIKNLKNKKTSVHTFFQRSSSVAFRTTYFFKKPCQNPKKKKYRCPSCIMLWVNMLVLQQL